MTRGVRKNRKWIREIGRHGLRISYETRQWKGRTLKSAMLNWEDGKLTPLRPAKDSQMLWRNLRGRS